MVDVPVEVKKAFKKGRTRKQYRIEVYTIVDDNNLSYEFTIGNDNLVKESVKIDERMCSDKYVKFGLCEGASMEFQYFGKDSITGKKLKVYLDVWYDNGEGGAWYPIMMGYFDVDQCSTQFSTGIIKATAYNKLQSKYLDSDITSSVKELVEEGITGFSGEIPITMVLDDLLSEYAIITDYQQVDVSPSSDPSIAGGVVNRMVAYRLRGGSVVESGYMVFFVQQFTYDIGEVDEEGVYQLTCFVKRYSDYFYNKFYEYLVGYTNDSAGRNPLAKELAERDVFGGLESILSVAVVSPDPQYDYVLKKIIANYFKESRTNNVSEKKEMVTNLVRGELDLNECSFVLRTPILMKFTTNPSESFTNQEILAARSQTINAIEEMGGLLEVGLINSSMGELRLTNATVSSIENVTLRELQSAIFETQCQYGQINRETDYFSGIELDSTGLYPRNNLYPANDLYPNGNTGGKAIHPYPSEYQKLWTDTVGVQSFRYLRITYKTIEDGSEVEKVLQRTVHEHGTQNYNMSDNWLFLNLVWTAEQVGEYADAMVEKMRDITWFPFEMWSVGLPYVETGDAIEIADKEGNTYTSYILQRQLRGIQNLQDSFINGELDVF